MTALSVQTGADTPLEMGVLCEAEGFVLESAHVEGAGVSVPVSAHG